MSLSWVRSLLSMKAKSPFGRVFQVLAPRIGLLPNSAWASHSDFLLGFVGIDTVL